MGLIDALRAFLSPPATVQRGLTQEQLWGTGWTSMASAGVPTGIEEALKSIAVQAAIRLLVNDIGSLPVDAFRKVDGQQRKELTTPPWVGLPNPLNPNDTWEDHIKQVVFSMLSDGNAFVRCFPSVFQTEGIESLDPASVDIKPFRQSVVYSVRGEGDLSPAEILHIPWLKRPGKARGFNPLEAAKEGIGIAIAADQFVGSYFGNGATLGGVLKYPPGVQLDDAQIKDVLDKLNKAHKGAKKAHAIGALTDGAELVFPEYNNRNAQLLELREHIVEEVARLFGIPPHMLGSQRPGAVSYASVEQRSKDYTTHAVLPITRRLETGYSRLLRGQRTYIKFNVRGLLEGDSAARAAYYDSLLQNKVIKREEVRALEDFEWDGELGYLETPNNNAPDEAAPEEPTRVLDEVTQENDVTPAEVRAIVVEMLSGRADGVPVGGGSVIQIMPSPIQNVVNVPEQPAPIVNVEPQDLSPVADVVRGLTAGRDAEQRDMAKLIERASAPPLVTVSMPDTMNMRIVEQPKRKKRTRITSRDGAGRVVETETDEE